ncbi:MAG TPA: PEP-CTERM sorting domain-containing protein [Fimbriimonadaceae bacterium]|nr:PEP-CTERM sorting domain-containing protein [Fimbriimonadaceae bacterium]
MRFFAALSCLAVSAMSQALLLDNFTVPYSRTINSGSWVDFQTDPTLYTGERDVELHWLRNSTGPIALEVGQGQLSLSLSAGVTAGVFLEYDGIGDEVNNIGENRLLIHRPNTGNAFPDGTRIVRFHVLSVTSASSTLGVVLYKNGVAEFINSRNPVVGGSQVVDVPFSPGAFAQCDAIKLTVSGTGTQIVLSHVELVPEPATLLALGAGAALLLRSKRSQPNA